jgi:hypothetical protein
MPRLVSTTYNDRYPWKHVDDGGMPLAEYSQSTEILHLFHVPLVKRILFLIVHVAFTFLFVGVAFQVHPPLIRPGTITDARSRASTCMLPIPVCPSLRSLCAARSTHGTMLSASG